MNGPGKSRPLAVAAVGLGDQMQNAMRLFFQGPCKNACVLGPQETAEISIIDLDAYNGMQLLEEQQRDFPQRPIIALSLHEKALEDVIFVRKPVDSTLLLDAIHQASAQLRQAAEQPVEQPAEQSVEQLDVAAASPEADEPEASVAVTAEEDFPEPTEPHTDAKRSEPSTHRAAMFLDERSTNTYIGSARDIDPHDQEQVAKAQYDPNEFLQSHFMRACAIVDRKGASATLSCPLGTFFFLADSSTVRTAVNENRLRSLSVVPISGNTVSIESQEQMPDTSGEQFNTIDREALLWKAALWASRGRVPLGTSFMVPVQMRRWPNLTRLMVFPHALRIAALWGSAPFSLIDTAKQLNIPQRNVFAFYSAAHAIGLVDMAAADGVSVIKPRTHEMPVRKGILSRIISRLKWQ